MVQYPPVCPMKRFVKCILELLTQKGGEMAKWQSGKVSGFCHLDFATSLFECVIPCCADTL